MCCHCASSQHAAASLSVQAIQDEAPMLVTRPQNRTYFSGLFSKDGACSAAAITSGWEACLPTPNTPAFTAAAGVAAPTLPLAAA